MKVSLLTEDEAVVRAASLAAIHAAAFSDSGSRAWSAGEFTELARRATCRIFSTDHGCLVLDVVAEEAEILTFAVTPGEQNKGIGRALLGSTILWMKKNGVIRCHLEVAENNFYAISLYKSHQFKPAARRANYFIQPEGLADALVLVRTLETK